MTDNLFDNFVKEKMQNHTASVPADMWDRIAQDKKRRTGFVWWNYLFIAGAFLILALSGWLALHSSPDNVSPKSNVGNTLQPKHEKYNTPSASSATAMEKSNSNDANTSSAQAFQTEQPVNTGNWVNGNAGNGMMEQKNSDNALTRNESSTSEVKSSSAKQSFQFQKKRKATFHNPPNSREFTIDSKENDAIKNAEEEQSNFISLHPSLLLSEKEQRNYRQPGITNFKSSFGSVDCPVNTDRRNELYVEGFISPDYSIRKVNAPGNRAYYLSRKDSMESRMASFTAGIRLSKSLGEHMMFKTGLQYSQINEKFSFRAEDERRLTTVVTIRTITHTDGSTTVVRDTSIIEQIGYRVKTSYNKYRSIDLPIILGYEFCSGKWKGGVNMGAIFNLSSWQQGETLDTSFSTLAFSKDNTTIFKKRVGMGLFGSLSLSRTISPSFDIFAEPYIRYNLSSLTNSNSPFNQKFHVAGMFVGVRYKLFGSGGNDK